MAVCSSIRSDRFIDTGNRFFPSPVDQVPYGRNRVPEYHTGARVPHYGSDSFPHRWLETVYRAFGASRLALLERAFVKALAGIVQKR